MPRGRCEAGHVAERALAVAPETPTIASRLVRALALRGQGDAVEPTLVRLGVPLERWVGLRAEVAIHRGAFADAIGLFDAWVAAEPEHPYAVNFAIVARILADRCEDAALAGLARIQTVEQRGVDTNLSWTYSLTAQALVGAERWPRVDALLERWATKHPEDVVQARWFGIASRVGRVTDAELEALVVARLAEDARAGPADTVAIEGCELLVLANARAATLARCAEVAEQRAFNLDTPLHERKRWTRLARHVEAQRLEQAGDVTTALARYEASLFPLAEVRHELDLMQRVRAAYVLARARERHGLHAAAREAWRTVRDAGYARLYQTSLWLAARRALADITKEAFDHVARDVDDPPAGTHRRAELRAHRRRGRHRDIRGRRLGRRPAWSSARPSSRATRRASRPTAGRAACSSASATCLAGSPSRAPRASIAPAPWSSGSRGAASARAKRRPTPTTRAASRSRSAGRARPA